MTGFFQRKNGLIKLSVILLRTDMWGRSTIGNIFMLKQTVENRTEFNEETHLVSVDLEKSFGGLDRATL